ncbi:hypothetical protein HDU96_009922 [Phlyctochytrium bullatum]|nr:hypothetical protein HDU96_009922 [Phlyctochytrium bullatum]
MTSSSSAFDTVTAVRLIGESGETKIYDGQVPPDWNIGFVPLGGMTLSIGMRAVEEFYKGKHPDPIICTANFLRPSRAGQPVRIEVQPLKSGRQYSTAIAIMFQKAADDGAEVPITHIVTTWGDLTKEKGFSLPGPPPPTIEPLAELEDQVYPAPVPWAINGIGKYIKHRTGEMREEPRRAQWVRFTDNRAPDLLSLTLFSDAFTPTLMNLGLKHLELAKSYYPTMEINIHYRRKPKDGWLALMSQSRSVINGRLETEVDLYDEDGHLVAMSRQMNLIVPFTRNAKYSSDSKGLESSVEGYRPEIKPAKAKL